MPTTLSRMKLHHVERKQEAAKHKRTMTDLDPVALFDRRFNMGTFSKIRPLPEGEAKRDEVPVHVSQRLRSKQAFM
jgi:hypothetical protein